MTRNYRPLGPLDIYFHMANHYRKLKSVKSVVDTSPPTGYGEKHNVRHSMPPSRTSKHRQSMSTDRLCTSSFCLSDFNNDLPRSNRSHSVPPRPPTRRKQDSTAQDLFRLRSSDTPKRDCTCPHKSRSPRSQHCNKCSPGVDTLAQYIEASATLPTPAPRTKTPRMDDVVKDSISEHEYLQFSLRITEDIIRNDLYTNRDMRRVFNSHLEANRGRLDMAKMLEHIQKLSVELNIPLDASKDSTQNRRTQIKASQQALKNNLACQPCSVKPELRSCECGSMRALPLQKKRTITCPSELSTDLHVIKVNSQLEPPSRADSMYGEYLHDTGICPILPLDTNYFYCELPPSTDTVDSPLEVRPSLACAALPLVPLEVTLSRITEKTEVTTSTETGFEPEMNKEKFSEAVPTESNANEGDYSINFKELPPSFLESSPPQGNKDMLPHESRISFKPPEVSFHEKSIQIISPFPSSISALQDIEDLDVAALEKSNDILVQSENKPQVSQTNNGSPIESTVNQIQSFKDAVPPSDPREPAKVRTCHSPNKTEIQSPKESAQKDIFTEPIMTYDPNECTRESMTPCFSKEPMVACVVKEPTVTCVSSKPIVNYGPKMNANKTYLCCPISPNFVPTEFGHVNQSYSCFPVSQNVNQVQAPIDSVKSCPIKQSYHSCGNSVYTTVSSVKSTHEAETQTLQPLAEKCCNRNLSKTSKSLKMKNDMQGQKKSENNESKHTTSSKSSVTKTLSIHNASNKFPTTSTSPQSINCTESEPIQSSASLVSDGSVNIDSEATAAPIACNESVNTQVKASPAVSRTVSHVSQALEQVFTIPCKCKEKEKPRALPFNQDKLEEEYILIPGPIYVPKSSIAPFRLVENVFPSNSSEISNGNEVFLNQNNLAQETKGRPSTTALSFQPAANFPTVENSNSSCMYSVIHNCALETTHYNSYASDVSNVANIPTGAKITESVFGENFKSRLNQPPKSILNLHLIGENSTSMNNNLLTHLNDYDLTPQRDDNRSQRCPSSISETIHQPNIFISFNNENLLLGDKYEIKDNLNGKSDSSDNGIPLSIRQFFPNVSTQTHSSDFLLVPNLSYEGNCSLSYYADSSLSNFLENSQRGSGPFNPEESKNKAAKTSRSLNKEKQSNRSSISSGSFKLIACAELESEAASQVQYIEDDQGSERRESQDYKKQFEKIRRRNTEILSLPNDYVELEDVESDANIDGNKKNEHFVKIQRSVSDNFEFPWDQLNHNNKESRKSSSTTVTMETQTGREENQLLSSEQLLETLFEEPQSSKQEALISESQQETEPKGSLSEPQQLSEPKGSMLPIEPTFPETCSHDRQHLLGKMEKRFETQLHHLGSMERLKARDQQRWREELDELEVNTLDLNSQEGDQSKMSVPKFIIEDKLKERNSLQQKIADDWNSLTPGQLQQQLVRLEYANFDCNKPAESMTDVTAKRLSEQSTGSIKSKSSVQPIGRTSIKSITSTPAEKFVMFQSKDNVSLPAIEPQFEEDDEDENQQTDLREIMQLDPDEPPPVVDRHRPSMMMTINEVRSNLEKFRSTQVPVEGSARERFNLPSGATNRKAKIGYSSSEDVPIIEVEKSEEHIGEPNEEDATSQCCGLRKQKQSKRRDLIQVERSENHLLNISSFREQIRAETAMNNDTERSTRFDTPVASGIEHRESTGFQYESIIRKSISQKQIDMQNAELDDVERHYIEHYDESDDDRRFSECSVVFPATNNHNIKTTPSMAAIMGKNSQKQLEKNHVKGHDPETSL